MDPIKKDMFEQLMRVFARVTQLRYQAQHLSPASEQCIRVMEGIVKLNKVINRTKPENYVKRGASFIAVIKAIDKSFNGDEALKSHYYKQPDDSLQLAVDDTDLKKEIEIIPVTTEQVTSTGRGGSRQGAGRKSLGVKKPVSVTVPQEKWHEIDILIQNKRFASYADFVRHAILSTLSDS